MVVTPDANIFGVPNIFFPQKRLMGLDKPPRQGQPLLTTSLQESYSSRCL